MKNDQPIPILAIAVTANRDRHQVLVELGKQTLALAPEAAHAMAAALSHAATELCPIAAERPQIEPPAVDESAALLIDTIDVLIGRYRGGTLGGLPAAPRIDPDKLKEAKRIGQRSGIIPSDAELLSKHGAAACELPARPNVANVLGGASISVPKE